MPKSVSKSDLVEHVAAKHQLPKKTVKEVVDSLFEHLAERLKQGEKVALTGFGSFEVRKRQARTGVKPGTSEKINIPASNYPAFKPGKTLKDSVNK